MFSLAVVTRMPKDMNRRRAAGRGALVAVLWASAILALLAAVRTTHYANWAFALLADAVFGYGALQASPVRVVAASLAAAAVVGGGFGLLARRVSAPPRTRLTLLAVASFPALYALIAIAVTLVWLPDAARNGFTEVAHVPVASLMYAAVAMVVVTPVAALPAVLAALMVEGWTRPETERATGLAHPSIRRRVVHVVLVVTAALTTFAALRWPR